MIFCDIILLIKCYLYDIVGVIMKVVIINGQNHKGSSYNIGKVLASKLTSDENITEFFMPKDLPHFCCGCNQCFTKNEKLCPHYDCMEPIVKAIDDADVMIFTSPVYVYHCTGSMKAFLDHFAYRWMLHRPNGEMFKKQAVCISTAAGAGMKSTCKDIKDSMFFWGVGKTYTYGVAVKAVNYKEVAPQLKDKINDKMEKIANKIKHNKDNVKSSVKAKGFFHVSRMLNSKEGWNPVDVKYWADNGWKDKKRPWKK